MAPKRQIQAPTTSQNNHEDSERPKKRRVSLACDSCRTAREKCDGAKPQCGACVSQGRPCSYTPATKKRGVQTGYLRTIELSLAWLFLQSPECESSLHALLKQPGNSRETRALLGKGGAGRQLQKVWTDSRVHKAIDLLLSETPNAASDEKTSGNNSDHEEHLAAHAQPRMRAVMPRFAGQTDDASSAALSCRPDQSHQTKRDRSFTKLPDQWERLLHLYASYTHCWLPIAQPDALHSLATSYGSHGVELDLATDPSNRSLHAELWAALAIASFQDIPRPGHDNLASWKPADVFLVARSLLPADDGIFDIHSVNATIIHAVILIGRGKAFAASLLLGKAARILHHQTQSAAETSSRQASIPSTVQRETALLSCALLDTLTCSLLDQPAMTNVYGKDFATSTTTMEYSGFDKPWPPMPSFSASFDRPGPTIQPMMWPIRTMVQLHAFTTVLDRQLSSSLKHGAATQYRSPEDLVRKLDSRFSFCNSLIGGSSIPTVPSAYLVKLLFLATTIELAPEVRCSLVSGFLELVESCLEKFGAALTPPIVLLLLQLVEKRAKTDNMGETEQATWRSAMERLRNIWQDEQEPTCAPRASMGKSIRQQNPQRESFIQPCTSHGHGVGSNNQGHSSPPATRLRRAGSQKGGEASAQTHFGHQDAVPDAASMLDSASYTTHTTHANNDRVDARLALPTSDRMNQNFDYDALFEDLGSFGCTDDLEMDSRFMTNLGFAPGCDLAEIFQGDFGV
ncbi:uncharacterized protein UV8b_07179 [Ustilaginoidea virens]|uniref:Zn(2)-C6 fungal-type domain-containing protein n=1 Tax=Ustilaginoidea virens TaxID=1159556 RepID=A0A8E5MJT1_USTVR|nr:uncharacterized protein UV8b_07179 [Ustilaginoidea virens]QUC22938.1 hypothetical protein UV8b_07179 [Ustilaginoidea virens]